MPRNFIYRTGSDMSGGTVASAVNSHAVDGVVNSHAVDVPCTAMPSTNPVGSTVD